MTSTPRRIFSAVVLTVVLCATAALCRADDLQSSIHTMVDYYHYADPKGAKWETDKKMLAGYSPEQIVRALLAEIDLDRDSPLHNKLRDVAASKLFGALNLPPTLVCRELEKQKSPERKASLMVLLRESKSPETTPALLAQLADHRPVIEPDSMPTEIAKAHPLRVCDVAFNTLAANLDIPGHQRVTRFLGDKHRDEIIEATLTELKLTPP